MQTVDCVYTMVSLESYAGDIRTLRALQIEFAPLNAPRKVEGNEAQGPEMRQWSCFEESLRPTQSLHNERRSGWRRSEIGKNWFRDSVFLLLTVSLSHKK